MVMYDWEMGQIVMRVGGCVIFLVSLCTMNPLWRMMLHCVGLGFTEIIRVHMICVHNARRSWACLVI